MWFGLRDIESVGEAAFGTSSEQRARQKLESLSLRYREQKGDQ
jgi:hypothetical protein